MNHVELDFREMLTGFDDRAMDAVIRAVVRERVIRQMVTKTGEERQHVADMVDAMESMGQEAVLDLTEGEPTTLRAALDRYVDALFDRSSSDDPGGDDIRDQEIGRDLTTILNYPFPGPSVELEIVHRDEDHLEVRVGGMFLFSAVQDDHGRSGLKALENASRAVHREVTTRLGSA